MNSIDSVLAEADRAWRSHGVAAADRRRLGADLRLDLESAASDGIDPAGLIEGDVATFARDLADEAGLTSGAPQHSRFLLTSLFGGLLGGVAGGGLLIAIFALSVRLFDLPRGLHIPPYAAAVFIYSLPAAAFVAGAVVAVRLRLRDAHRAAETARVLTLLLPLTAIVITPITIAFARATGYSVHPAAVLIEAALVLAALTGAVITSRQVALRATARQPRMSPAS